MTSLHARFQRWRSTRHQDQNTRLRPAASLRGGHADESGSVLILALIFLVVVSVIVVSLLSWLGTSLTATANVGQQRSLEAAATNAVNLAIQNTRTTFAAQIGEQPAVGLLVQLGRHGPATSARPQQQHRCRRVVFDVLAAVEHEHQADHLLGLPIYRERRHLRITAPAPGRGDVRRLHHTRRGPCTDPCPVQRDRPLRSEHDREQLAMESNCPRGVLDLADDQLSSQGERR